MMDFVDHEYRQRDKLYTAPKTDNKHREMLTQYSV